MNHAALAAHPENYYVVECVGHYHADGSKCPSPWEVGGDPGCPHGLAFDAHDHRQSWLEEIENLVVTIGLNRYLSATLKGSATGGPSGGYPDGRRMPVKWATGTAYVVGDVVRPTNASGQIDNNRIFICEVAGTSHASTEPTWTNSSGASVTDNTVTWREFSTWFVGLKGAGSAVAGDTMASHGAWSEVTPYSNATRPQLTLGSVAAGSVDNSAAKAVFNINGSQTVAGVLVCDLATPGGNAVAGCSLLGAGDFSGGNRSVQNGDTLNVTVTLTES